MAVTPNYKLILPAFDKRGWQDDWYNTMAIIDAVIATVAGSAGFTGVWANSTEYDVGDKAVDDELGSVWECLVANTSAATPTTFAEERAANPTYWQLASVGVRFRGAWAAATDYAIGDFVYSGYIYAVATQAHTSAGTFAADAAKWDYLVDLTDAVDAAEAAETNAAASATAAGNSAAAASASATAAGNSATAAQTAETNAETAETNAETAQAAAESVASAIAVKWLYDATTAMADPGTGDIRFNNADPTLATQIAISALTADTGNPDKRAQFAAWGNSTSTVKGTLVFTKQGASNNYLVFNITGVTDNTTWLQLAVTAVAGSVTLSAADPLFGQFTRTGDKGEQGDPGTGTVTSVTAGDGSITIGGTADDPTVAVASGGVSLDKLAAGIIASASTAAIALADLVLFADASGANATRKDSVQNLLALTPAASETVAGIIEVATQAEVTTGTSDVLAITPKKLTEFAPATATPDVVADSFLFIDVTDSKIKKGTLPSSSPAIIHLRQSLASGSFQGSTGGAWTKVPINTEVVDTGGNCSLSSSVFTLAAGTYNIWAWQFLFNGDPAKLRLRNTSDGTTAIVGGNFYPNSGANVGQVGVLVGQVVIASSKNFELQYYATTGSASRGLGYEVGSGEAEVYCDVWMEKTA